MAHPDIVVEKNLRAYPGVERGSTEWEETYKIRVKKRQFRLESVTVSCINGSDVIK